MRDDVMSILDLTKKKTRRQMNRLMSKKIIQATENFSFKLIMEFSNS